MIVSVRVFSIVVVVADVVGAGFPLVESPARLLLRGTPPDRLTARDP